MGKRTEGHLLIANSILAIIMVYSTQAKGSERANALPSSLETEVTSSNPGVGAFFNSGINNKLRHE